MSRLSEQPQTWMPQQNEKRPSEG